MTLTELVVASVLIGIVMVGIASFSFVIKQLQDSINRKGIITLRASTGLTQITNEISLASGQNAIDWDDGNDAICARQDQNIPVTPDDTSDDTWICFTQGAANLVSRCEVFEPAQPDTTVLDCSIGGTETIQLGSNGFFTVQQTAGNIEFIEFSLNVRFDSTIAVHPITNPQTTISTRVVPPGLAPS